MLTVIVVIATLPYMNSFLTSLIGTLVPFVGFVRRFGYVFLLVSFICFGAFRSYVWHVGSVRWFPAVFLLISFICFGSFLFVSLACWCCS